VLIVDERRLLAAGLAHVLAARPAISQASVLQEPSSLQAALAGRWDVVVCSETYAGTVLSTAPPATRVLLMLQEVDVPRTAALLTQGAAGVCTPEDLPADVADAVEAVAQGEMRLPRASVRALLDELQRVRNRATRADDVLAQLTERERDVLLGLGQGRGRAEIGRALGISPHTVRTHIQHLLAKLSLHSQLEAAAFAREMMAARAAVPDPEAPASQVIDLNTRREPALGEPGLS
jgi:DNA-binding NarL/FixJ family response regulator